MSHGFGRGGHGAELSHVRGMRRFENAFAAEKAVLALLKVSHGLGRGGHGTELVHVRGMRRFENAFAPQKTALFLLNVFHGTSHAGRSALEALFRYE